MVDFDEIENRVARSWLERATHEEVEAFFDQYYRVHGLEGVTLEEARAIDRELTASGKKIGCLLSAPS